MDELLPPAFFDALSIFLLSIGVIVIVVVSNYLLIVPTVLLVLALWLMRRFYIRTARDVKRIESVGKLTLLNLRFACFVLLCDVLLPDIHFVSYSDNIDFAFQREVHCLRI